MDLYSVCDIRKGDWSDLCYSVGEAHDLVPFRNTWRHSNRCHTAFKNIIVGNGSTELISLFIKSFALPVGIALGGGLSGLVFLAKHLGHIWPYSLMAYGMNSNAPQELLESGYVWFVVICIVYIVLFMTISSMIQIKI